MTKYLNDPREETLRTESGVGYYLEEDNREEKMYRWGAKVLDLCDLPVEEYMKPMTVICEGGDIPSPSGTTEKYTLKFYVNDALAKTYTLEAGNAIPTYDVSQEGYDVSEWQDENGNTYTTMPDKNLNLYCTKTIKSFNVRFLVDDVVISAYTVNYNNIASPIPVPEKPGYIFEGWIPSVDSPITTDTDFVASFIVIPSDINDLYYGIKYNSELSNLENIQSGLTYLDLTNHDSQTAIFIQPPTLESTGRKDDYMDYYDTGDAEFDRQWEQTYAYSIIMVVPNNKDLTEFRQGSLDGPNWVGTVNEHDYGTVTINNIVFKVLGYRVNTGISYVVTDASLAPKKIFFNVE